MKCNLELLKEERCLSNQLEVELKSKLILYDYQRIQEMEMDLWGHMTYQSVTLCLAYCQMCIIAGCCAVSSRKSQGSNAKSALQLYQLLVSVKCFC